MPLIVGIYDVGGFWSHHFWSIWFLSHSGSGTQSHQVLVFAGRPVASTSGISQGVFLLFHAGVLLIFMLRTLHRHQNLPAG
jgi:hypothetical protein